MKLYIMRHGSAEDQSASGHDEDRVLTSPGRERVRRVARALIDAGEAPARIISSPLVRALQTAEIVAAACDLRGRVDVRREIAPGGRAALLVQELEAERARRVMLVGHEPDLSRLVAGLVGAALPHGVQKAMVVGVKVATLDNVRPRFVLDPRSLGWDWRKENA